MKAFRSLVPAILIAIGVCLPCRAADWDFRKVVVDEDPPQPGRITDVEIVDINGDGRADLWFSGSKIDPDERRSAWYERTDDGWVRHTPFPGPSLGGNWGDVDGDGDLDLITGQDRNRARTGNHALVWMANPLREGGDPGTDAWQVHQIHPDPADPDELHTGHFDLDGRYVRQLDLNRDGRLDIVVAAFKHTLWYLPGPPDAVKGRWRLYKIAEDRDAHGGAAIADLDRDGDLDIVWGHSWYENPGNPVMVPWRSHEIDSDWTDECKIAIGDINRDGWPDIVLTGEENAQGLAWYRNPVRDPRRPWERQEIVKGWLGLHSCRLADFDLDGDLDVFTAQMHGRPGQRVAIFENQDPSKNLWQEHIIAEAGSHNAKVGDLDGDGDADIVGKNYEDDKRPRIWLNPRDPKLPLDRWQRHVVDANNPSRYTILAGDLTRNGKPDLVTGTVWYRNLGSAAGPWLKKELPGAFGNALLLHDLDADGDLDILGEGLSWASNWGGSFGVGAGIAGRPGYVQGAAVLGYAAADTPTRLLQIAYTYKNGNAVRLLTVPASPARTPWEESAIYDWSGRSKCLDAGDIDRDGDTDIAFVGRDGAAIEWLRNEGDGRYTPVELAESPATINHRCRLADLNGDGRLDLVVCHKGRLATWFEQPSNPAAIWRQRIIADDRVLRFDPLSLDVADMDADGDLDVILGEHTPDETKARECSLYILENADLRATRWQAHAIHTGDEHHQGAQTVDIDCDGDLDIVSVGWTHSRVLLYENLAQSRSQ